MKKRWNWVYVVLLVLVAGLAAFIFIRWWNSDIVPVKTSPVVRGAIEQVVTASGLVDAPVYELGPKIGGKIMKINVKEGENVRGGETLAEFDDTTRLVAPASGVVAKINYDIGETASPAQPAIVIVNYGKSWVEAQIDEIDIAGVKIGDKVKITSDVYPDKAYAGEIYWIAPLAELRKVGGRVKLDEESYVFPCKVRFLGEHDELKVNMSVNVDITTKRKNAALIIPREALLSRDETAYVFAVDRDRSQEKKIELGIRSFTSLEVLSGLSEGELVAVTNLNKLKNKGRVSLER